MKEEIVTAAHLAEFLNLTERRIQQLAKEGVLSREDRGRYKFLESIKHYIKFIQECAYGDRAIGTDLQAARARESMLKGDVLEMQLAEKSGQLVFAEEMEDAWTSMITAARIELGGLAVKVHEHINAEYGIKIKDSVIEEHIDLVLSHLATGGYSDDEEESETLPTT